jgi:hypothetical protein
VPLYDLSLRYQGRRCFFFKIAATAKRQKKSGKTANGDNLVRFAKLNKKPKVKSKKIGKSLPKATQDHYNDINKKQAIVVLD